MNDAARSQPPPLSSSLPPARVLYDEPESMGHRRRGRSDAASVHLGVAHPAPPGARGVSDGSPATGLFLVVARGNGIGARVRVEDAARVVGRARDADLVLFDVRASRRHFQIVADGDGATVPHCVVGSLSCCTFLLDGMPFNRCAAYGDAVDAGVTCM